MGKFVGFLKTINTSAAQYVHEMEEIIFNDPSSAIVKGRKFLEVILNDISKYEELDEFYHRFSLYEKIAYLIKEQIIDGKAIQKSFDVVRRVGNKAAHHSDTNEYADAFKVHKEIYNIAVWYHHLYADVNNNNDIPLYEAPKPQSDFKEILQFMNKVQNLIVDRENNKVPVGIDIRQEDKTNEPKTVEVEELKLSNKDIIDNSSGKLENKKVDEKEFEILKKDLPEGESYLIREINRLKTSSKEAVENANQFSHFKDYLHVERPILNDLEKVLVENSNKKHGNLILLCGNVGDGKSHILAYLNQNKPDLIKDYKIYNDATESFSPEKDALATLEESLSGFSDQKIDSNQDNLILAINLGVLHNFISRKHENYTYKRLSKFIDDSQLFSSKIQPTYTKNQFSLLSFGDYNSFELTDRGASSTFYSALLKKIVDPTETNPFYLALKEDEKNEIQTIIHDNYRLLQNEIVQQNIVHLVIQSIILDKLVISARAFLNFVADILIPNNYQLMEYKSNAEKLNYTNFHESLSDLEKMDYTLPNLLFSHSERSDILRSIYKLDPLHRRSEKTDQLVIELNTLNEWDNVIKENIEDKVVIHWFSPFFNQEALPGYTFEIFFETFIRTLFLLNKKFAESLIDNSYKNYLNYLYHFNRGNNDKIIEFYNEFKKVLIAWKGSPKKEFIYINKPAEKYRIAQKLNLRPNIDHIKTNSNEVLQKFNTTILIAYEGPGSKNKVELDIDYPLYKLLNKVKNGYRPNKRDDENAIQFTEFIDKLMKVGNEKAEMLVYYKSDNRLYSFNKGDFGSYVFERESNYSG